MEDDVLARRVYNAGVCGSRRRPLFPLEGPNRGSLSLFGAANWPRRARSGMYKKIYKIEIYVVYRRSAFGVIFAFCIASTEADLVISEVIAVSNVDINM